MIIEKCKTREGYKIKLENKVNLDLRKLKENKNWKTVLWTPLIVLGTYKEVEIIVHKYGDLQFKQENDIEKIKKIAEEIYFLLKSK